MAREQTETEIDGVKFRMALLRPSEARQLMARIGKVAGHGFLERATKIDAKDPGAAVIGMMLSAMGDPSFAAEQEAVFAVLGKVSEMEVGDGKFVPLTPQNQDAHFVRRLKLMYRWAWECLRFQFADFFASAGQDPGAAE